ncbi:hypothetical protein BC829DRAFT_80237 [Chytridium lagenaria]|nr:hypothetical protein BC829DRAFT_80237 [Chytridium lagenaria]
MERTEWREVEVKQDAKDVNVQTDYILSPTPPTLPFKITRSKAIQCTFPSSAASPDSPTPPSPTRQESKLLSLKIRLSYANTIMALQNETIEQLESQITLYRDQQDSQAIQTAQTDTRIHHVEAIGATKDRVVEELSRRLMVLETEQLATSLRKRVGGEQQRMTHRRTASATALDSRRAIHIPLTHIEKYVEINGGCCIGFWDWRGKLHQHDS